MKTVSEAILILITVGFALTSTRSMGRGPLQSNLIGKHAPEIAEGTWFNTSATSLAQLRGKVVLLEFWTFGCYNCRNTLPYMKLWHEKFSGSNFQIIGVHTPEFESEKNLTNVRNRIAQLAIKYPVVTDNEYKTWNAYDQQYWPVMYLLDKKGIIRYVHIGEGNYDVIERQITALIAEE